MYIPCMLDKIKKWEKYWEMTGIYPKIIAYHYRSVTVGVELE